MLCMNRKMILKMIAFFSWCAVEAGGRIAFCTSEGLQKQLYLLIKVMSPEDVNVKCTFEKEVGTIEIVQ